MFMPLFAKHLMHPKYWYMQTRGWLFKLTTLLVNIPLNFQMLISQVHQYFFVEKM